MTTPQDKRFMQLAISLGRRGLGNVAPNPAVGCVIVQDRNIVGRGWTQPGGRPHAEVVALKQAGAASRGADVYVTLEPCSHHGKTPPCAHALIKAGVARVFVATKDPDPRVNGAGVEMLKAAGIEVLTGLCEAEARHEQAGFLKTITEKRPFVTLKLASSFDGRIATASGESQWITGSAARRAVHAERMRHDAVMIGAATARIDDPSLTVRGLGTVQQPKRIVLSRRLDLPLDGQLAKTARDIPLILCHAQDAPEKQRAAWDAKGAQRVECKTHSGQIDIDNALEKIAALGITRIFCEGGSALAASLLIGERVDRLVGFTAGLAIGAEGLPNLGALGLASLNQAPRFKLRQLRSIGEDIFHEWEPNPHSGSDLHRSLT